MRTPQLSALRTLLAAGFLVGTNCFAVDNAPVVVANHSGDSGKCFALAVRSPLNETQSISRHVILVDTSASQVGEVRESTLRLVSEVLAGLPTNGQVQLFAVDVECQALTDGFVPTASREINDAVQQLALRTPLGTTSLHSALVQVGKLANVKMPTSVLYIGDGLSSADRIAVDELKNVVATLRDGKMSVHSLVLGPQASTEVPSILANLTGGTVARAFFGLEASAASTVSASMMVAPVEATSFLAGSVELPIAGLKSVLLRSDRHTVVFGHGNLAGFPKLTANIAGGKQVEWVSASCSVTEGGPEIKHLLTRIESSDGVNASIASLHDLQSAAREFEFVVSKSIAASEQLQRSGNFREAQKLINAVNQLDPSRVAGSGVILTGVRNGQEGTQENPFADEATILSPAPAPVDPGFGQDAFPGAPTQPDSPLSEVETEVKLKTQILTAETNAAIEEAKQIGNDSPDFAMNLLKDILESIQASADISPDVRAELERRVIGALGTVRNQREVSALIRKQVAKDQAVAEAQRKFLADQDIEEERLAILIDQVRSLLDRARHGDRNGFEDGESVSRIALDLRPGNGPATQALVMSEASGQLDKAYRLVNLRHDRFLETLYQVELSHVPFPDEPPIQYPPADVWRALTLTRKPKYESFDLRNEKPVEKWLGQMLDKPVPRLDYQQDTPLSEVLELISTYFTTTWGQDSGASGTDFRMTIYEDSELAIDGIESLEDVSVSKIDLEGITLRNALKLIFDQTKDPGPELTYVIENEVLKVTTRAAADEKLTTRVYPVADLVIPPVQLGGSQGGGGFGGGGQGGFGGGGGGQFSLAPEALAAFNAAPKGGFSSEAVQQLKKKPSMKR